MSATIVAASRTSFWAGVVVFALTVAATGWLVLAVTRAVTDPNQLPIARVHTFGERHFVSDEQIQQALRANGGLASLIEQDMAEVKARIEALPWVARVSVRRTWPDAVSLYITEQVPVARWNSQQLLNAAGQPFTVPDRERAGPLPQLQGADDSSAKVLDGWQRFSQLLAQGGHEPVLLTLTSRHAWNIQLSSGIELRLGKEDDINRIARFINVFSKLSAAEQPRVAYADMRYDTGLAMGWRPEEAQPTNGKQKGT